MKRLFICTPMTLGILASLSAANPYGGKVTCNGKGVPGVIVTDGIDCVTTGKDGAYTLSVTAVPALSTSPPRQAIKWPARTRPSGSFIKR